MGLSEISYGQPRAKVTVQVAATGLAPTGSVTLTYGSKSFGTQTLAGGVATFDLPPRSLPVGDDVLTVTYSGDSQVDGATHGLHLTVTKASSSITTKLKPDHPKAGKPVDIEVTVKAANNVDVKGGVVKVEVDGRTVSGTLKGNKVTLHLGSFTGGVHDATVSYLGSDTVEGAVTHVTFTVTN